MKTIIKSILIFLIINVAISAQVKNLTGHGQMNIDCKKCHVCDTPTKADPCLILCPRYKIEVVRHSPNEGPDNIVIDKIKGENDLYSPVNFSHRLHSEMSLMSGGCAACHHFNPPGNIVECAYCHETKRDRTDISKPDLKAAFHRQCMDCHASWSDNVKCVDCHALNSSRQVDQTPKPADTKAHPKIAEPTKLVYETEFDEGNLVTFFHNEHISLFNLECTDCHSNESCAKCHNQKAEFTHPTLDDSHDKCSSCHDTDNDCGSCHSEKERKPFNHFKATGFKLEKFHSGLSCISCHKPGKKFSDTKSNCSFCHKFDDGNFDHSVTKLELDENHIDNDCTDCHADNNYSKVSCDNCHDEDIVYPESLPGVKK